FLKVQSRQQQNVRIFQYFRKQPHDDRRRQHRLRRDLPIWQQPINQEKDSHAGERGKHFGGHESEHVNQENIVSERKESKQDCVPRAQRNRDQRQTSTRKRQSK